MRTLQDAAAMLATFALALTIAAPAPAAADDDYPAMVHCRDVDAHPEGWVRVTCPLELEPYAVRTLYVWFDREIPAQTVPVLNVTGAMYPVVVNQIRGEAVEGKRTYAKYRVWNPVAVEQYVTLIWLLPAGPTP